METMFYCSFLQLNDYQQRAMQQIYNDKISRIDAEISVLSRRYDSFGEERKFMIANYVDCDFDRFKYVIDESCRINQQFCIKFREKQKIHDDYMAELKRFWNDKG